MRKYTFYLIIICIRLNENRLSIDIILFLCDIKAVIITIIYFIYWLITIGNNSFITESKRG